MKQEQREEIEKAISFLDKILNACTFNPIQTRSMDIVLHFARQQLSLRVDGEKLRALIWKAMFGRSAWDQSEPLTAPKLEALVLECLTTEVKE